MYSNIIWGVCVCFLGLPLRLLKHRPSWPSQHCSQPWVNSLCFELIWLMSFHSVKACEEGEAFSVMQSWQEVRLCLRCSAQSSWIILRNLEGCSTFPILHFQPTFKHRHSEGFRALIWSLDLKKALVDWCTPRLHTQLIFASVFLIGTLSGLTWLGHHH